MIERIALVLVLALVGLVVYRLLNRYQVRRVSAGASHDPLLADYNRGQPGVMLFTADFCQPCKTQQMPALKRLTQEMDVQVIQVDVEAEPDAAERWGVLSLPTTYILDESGQPRHVNHGVTSTEKLKQQIEGLA